MTPTLVPAKQGLKVSTDLPEPSEALQGILYRVCFFTNLSDPNSIQWTAVYK
jgi:hypothetical protein